MKARSVVLSLVPFALLSAGCSSRTESTANDGNKSFRPGGDRNAIIGTWFVKDSAAPFPFHMYVFNADGTMQQANPDAGDTKTSDSDGKGVWVSDGNQIKGKFVEISADRTTHKFVGRGEISYNLRVASDTFAGNAIARFYDVDGKLIAGPFPTTLTGSRVTLP
jgi:hypothetical protein